jgi:serine/threonine protein kinase
VAWPSLQDYNEAIQNPKLNLSDAELKDGKPELNRWGLPIARSGAFATVYKLQCRRGTFAVKFFLTETPDRQQRYDEVGRFLKGHRLPYMIDIDFQPKGVIRRVWYPLLKMEWIQGQTLDEYVQAHLRDSSALAQLAQGWLTMIKDLQRAGIAHGDLQHGNVLVQNGGLRLIDYDDMYVPALSGRRSPENGHRNYQHPGRNDSHFGPYIDNFSAWIIYFSLTALSIDPSLWSGGGECLLFSAHDFTEPDRSRIFSRLEASNDGVVDQIPYLIRDLLATNVTQIPPLDELRSSSKSMTQPMSAGISRQWWKADYPSGEVARNISDDTPSLGSQWVLEHLSPASPVRFTGSVFYPRAIIVGIGTVVLALIGLTYFAFRFWPVSLGAAAANVFLAGITLVIGYRRQPEVAERLTVLSELKKARAAADAARRQLDEIEKRERDAEQGEHRQLLAMQSARQQIDSREKDELIRADNDNRGRVTDIGKRRQGVIQSRSNELSDGLRVIQEKWVNDGLARHDLRNAKIVGIGPEMQSRLVAAGIRTAADVSGYTLSPSGYGMSAKVYLRRPSGPVSVPGIGEKKADALLRWRTGLLAAMKSRQPTLLPSDILNMITSKYQAALANLDAEESKAREEFLRLTERVRTKFAHERTEQTVKYHDAEQHFERARRDRAERIRSHRDELRADIFKKGHLEHRFRSFANVSPTSYLRFISGLA